MKHLLQIALSLSVATSAFCQAQAHDDITDQKSPTHQACIMVIGPNLPTDVYNKCQILAQNLRTKNSAADIIVHKEFHLPQIQQDISQLRHRHGDKLHLTCIVNAHGKNINNTFYTQTHDGLKSDTQLKSVLGNCPTTLALLTCESGAFVDDSDNLEVFGGSSNKTILLERHFDQWIETATQSSCLLTTGQDFAKTWEEALKKSPSTCLAKFPFWNSTMAGNTVNGTKIQATGQ